MFVEVVGFSKMASILDSPELLVQPLNDLYSTFDELVDSYTDNPVFKVENIRWGIWRKIPDSSAAKLTWCVLI